MRRLTLVTVMVLILSGVTSGTALAGSIPGKVSRKIATVPTTPTAGTTTGGTGVVNPGTGAADPYGKFAKACAKDPQKYAICTPSVPAPAFIPPAAPQVICPASIGTVGTPYSSAIGITEITAQSVGFGVTGNLPPGLTLNPATGAITGTPTTAGTYPFTATATNSAGLSGSATCSIAVSPSPSLSIQQLLDCSFSPCADFATGASGTGFHPNSLVTVTYGVRDAVGGRAQTGAVVPTDASGSFNTGASGNIVIVPCPGVTAFATATDAFGLTASITVPGLC